jgi:glycogen synthase
MPSFYEPFGMANEFYLNGAVGIGRATGGILHQIIPYRSALSFTDSVRIRSDRWFSDASLPTGFLFREMDGIPNAVGNWQEINSATSTSKGGSPDWSEQRKKLPLFQSMVAELSLCLTDAVELYVNQQDLYYEMLADGYYHIRENFSWEKAARKYLEYLDR